MSRIVLLATIAVVLLMALEMIEMTVDEEPITVTALLFDLLETGLLVGAIAMTAHATLEMREFRRERSGLLSDLATATAEGAHWRQAARTHIEGLGQEIQRQFDAWRLTESESEIALLMLKGLSHKEIARLRRSSEATVRQQARAVYQKSSLGSRAELAAFFLEDLMMPAAGSDQTEPRPVTTIGLSAQS